MSIEQDTREPIVGSENISELKQRFGQTDVLASLVGMFAGFSIATTGAPLIGTTWPARHKTGRCGFRFWWQHTGRSKEKSNAGTQTRR
jgi:hypothetical protein